MNYPIIKFIFDQPLDQEIAWMFYKNQKFGGSHFWKDRALTLHPSLKKIDQVTKKQQFLNQYIADFYTSHTDECEQLSKGIVNNFKCVENDYFSLVDRVFKGYPWPRK